MCAAQCHLLVISSVICQRMLKTCVMIVGTNIKSNVTAAHDKCPAFKYSTTKTASGNYTFHKLKFYNT